MRRLFVLIGMMLMGAGVVVAQEKVAVVREAAQITIGEMRIQSVPELNYLHVGAETSFAEMARPVGAGFEKVYGAVRESKLMLSQPSLLVYRGNPHFEGQQTPFKMEIGVVIHKEAAPTAIGDCKVRKTEAFRCATILYTGTVKDQGQAWQKLSAAMRAASLTPSGEERAMCLYFEGMESSNNVFIMQVGIK